MMTLTVRKSHVPGHYRTLQSGRRIYVEPYFTKVVPKRKTPGKPRPKAETPAPKGRVKVSADALAHRLIQHVKDQRLSQAEAHAQLNHLEARAQAGQGMEHGGGHRWSPDEVHLFVARAREGLAAHAASPPATPGTATATATSLGTQTSGAQPTPGALSPAVQGPIDAINAYADAQHQAGDTTAWLALTHRSSRGPTADQARQIRDAGREALDVIQDWPTVEKRGGGAEVLRAPDGSQVLYTSEQGVERLHALATRTAQSQPATPATAAADREAVAQYKAKAFADIASASEVDRRTALRTSATVAERPDAALPRLPGSQLRVPRETLEEIRVHLYASLPPPIGPLERAAITEQMQDAVTARGTLQGSAKQVTWAEQIMSEKQVDIHRTLNSAQDQLKDRTLDQASFSTALTRAEDILKEAKARWWIDHRGVRAQDLLFGSSSMALRNLTHQTEASPGAYTQIAVPALQAVSDPQRSYAETKRRLFLSEAEQLRENIASGRTAWVQASQREKALTVLDAAVERALTATTRASQWINEGLGVSATKVFRDAVAKEGPMRMRKATPVLLLKSLRRFLLKARKLQGRQHIDGLDVSIEHQPGSVRAGNDADGKPWRTTMTRPYGYIKRSIGLDGSHVDAFIGPKKHPEKHDVHIITTKRAPDFDTTDEQKCFLGFKDAQAAQDCFTHHYDDKRYFGSILSMPWDDFHTKVLATLHARSKKIVP